MWTLTTLNPWVQQYPIGSFLTPWVLPVAYCQLHWCCCTPFSARRTLVAVSIFTCLVRILFVPASCFMVLVSWERTNFSAVEVTTRLYRPRWYCIKFWCTCWPHETPLGLRLCVVVHVGHGNPAQTFFNLARTFLIWDSCATFFLASCIGPFLIMCSRSSWWFVRMRRAAFNHLHTGCSHQ